MWYILKSVLVLILWLSMLIYYMFANIICIFIIFSFVSYSEIFNNNDMSSYYIKYDTNPIDTFKRYWSGNFW